jgi:DNA mismatch repair protein MutS
MRQYQAAKDKHPGMLLLFRIGDFYELFDQDAEKVSKLIGLTLTSRNGFPMCGFPHHQFEAYLHKLLKEGQKVAICEQVQDPANVPVRREVQRIVVPGEEGEPCTPRT